MIDYADALAEAMAEDATSTYTLEDDYGVPAQHTTVPNFDDTADIPTPEYEFGYRECGYCLHNSDGTHPATVRLHFGIANASTPSSAFHRALYRFEGPHAIPTDACPRCADAMLSKPNRVLYLREFGQGVDKFSALFHGVKA